RYSVAGHLLRGARAATAHRSACSCWNLATQFTRVRNRARDTRAAAPCTAGHADPGGDDRLPRYNLALADALGGWDWGSPAVSLTHPPRRGYGCGSGRRRWQRPAPGEPLRNR